MLSTTNSLTVIETGVYTLAESYPQDFLPIAMNTMKSIQYFCAITLMMVASVMGSNSALAQGSISGAVFDAGTGDAIEDARVVARGEWPNGGFDRTGEEGTFEIGELAAGVYSVIAFKRGFVPQVVEIEVIDGENSVVDFALAPPTFGGLEGVVTDAEGNPIEGAVVNVRRDNDRRDNRTRTDENGFYSFDELRAGDYTVKAFAEGFFVSEATATIEADSTTELNFELEPFMFGTVEGIVSDEEGNPVVNARVSLRRDRRGFGQRTRTDENGYYAFEDVLAGDYMISASARGFFKSTADVSVIANETTEVNFTLEALAFGSVSGFVIDAATGDAIERAVVKAGRGFTRTDEDGFYVIENVLTGTTNVKAFKRGYDRAVAEVEIIEDETALQDFALEPQDGDQ